MADISYYPFGIAVPVFGLAVCVALQVAFLRLRRSGLLRSLLLGFACGLGACLLADTALLALAAGPGPAVLPTLSVNLVGYAALGYCYFHFVNLGETARRIRIMREIHEAPGGLTESQILVRYNAREMVDKRLGRQVRNGQIVRQDGRYTIRPSAMLYITRLMELVRRLVFGRARKSLNG